MAEIKAIIFDLDGTLADTLPLCVKAFQIMIKKVLNVDYSEDQIIKYFGQSEEGMVKNLCPDNYDEAFNTLLEVYKDNHYLCPRLFDGIIDILEFLISKGYKLAMVTGKGKYTAQITLDFYEISKYFEYIETGSPLGSIKSECMAKILNKWQLKPNNALYVGDSPSDTSDAKKAGLLSAGVLWSSTAKPELVKAENPDFIFEKVSDFHNWLLSL